MPDFHSASMKRLYQAITHIQSPEECGAKTEARKAGYVNICEIGKERIRRAGAKLRAELDAQGVAPTSLDVGFRVYKLVDSIP